MALDPKTERALQRTTNRTLDPRRGPQDAWRLLDQANRVFGAAGWSREVLEMRCAATRERDGLVTTAYVARIRVTINAETVACFRDAHGCGEGKGTTPFLAHDAGLKAAELDATARALSTLGKRFGLGAFIDPDGGRTPSRRGCDEGPASQTRARADLSGPTASPNGAARESSGKRSAQDKRDQGRTAQTSEGEPDGDLPSHGAVFLPKPRRLRSPGHLAHVRSQPCLVCGRSPVDAHHLRFMQPMAMAKKVSDEFTVPLCRRHHDLLHRDPREQAWWEAQNIDPISIAEELWAESHAEVS